MWKMSSFPAAVTQLLFCKKIVTKPLFSASINYVEFLCQTRLILQMWQHLTSIRFFLELVASEYIPKDLPQLQTFSSPWKWDDAFFSTIFGTVNNT